MARSYKDEELLSLIAIMRSDNAVDKADIDKAVKYLIQNQYEQGYRKGSPFIQLPTFPSHADIQDIVKALRSGYSTNSTHTSNLV